MKRIKKLKRLSNPVTIRVIKRNEYPSVPRTRTYVHIRERIVIRAFGWLMYFQNIRQHARCIFQIFFEYLTYAVTIPNRRPKLLKTTNKIVRGLCQDIYVCIRIPTKTFREIRVNYRQVKKSCAKVTIQFRRRVKRLN